MSYQSLEQHNLAITHFTAAIKNQRQCYRPTESGSVISVYRPVFDAIVDAEITLSVPAYEEVVITLTLKQTPFSRVATWKRGKFKLASVFAEAALSGAIANGYPVGDIEALMESRDLAQALTDTEN